MNSVVVENSRAVSRDAMVAEELCQESKFLRRVRLAYTELEKDMVFHRLSHGIAEKRRVVQQAMRRAHQSKAPHVVIKGKKVPAVPLWTQGGKIQVNVSWPRSGRRAGNVRRARWGGGSMPSCFPTSSSGRWPMRRPGG